MGTDMSAFIEYDVIGSYRMYSDNVLKYRDEILILQPDDPRFPPFSSKDQIRSLSGYYPLNTGSKNYHFFAAIAGVRNESNKQPLYPPRGLPQLLGEDVECAIKKHHFFGEFGIGWLYHDEIIAALNHMAVPTHFIEEEILVLIDTLEAIEKRFGKRRARMIFGFWG